jgi:DNA primase
MIVGYTARRIDHGKPKYLMEQQPGYVFNLDAQNNNRKYVIVCEGQIDALSIGGLAVMGNDVSQVQQLLINQLQRDVIVVPDRDQPGMLLVANALRLGWSVSLPSWSDDIKDINDAIIKYGKLNTLLNIFENRHSSKIKIKLLLKQWMKNATVKNP